VSWSRCDGFEALQDPTTWKLSYRPEILLTRTGSKPLARRIGGQGPGPDGGLKAFVSAFSDFTDLKFVLNDATEGRSKELIIPGNIKT
jgi:hypothetical protein